MRRWFCQRINLNSPLKETTGVYPYKSRADPEDHFKVLSLFLLKWQNPTVTGCEKVAHDISPRSYIAEGFQNVSEYGNAICMLSTSPKK
jgi:hypothetical protein